MLSGADGCDPVSSLLLAYPTGNILLRDSLAASAHFLLPWITSAAVKQGHKVVVVAAAYSAAQHQGTLKKLGVSTAAFGNQQQQQQSAVAVVSALEVVRQAEEQQQAPLHALCQQVYAAAQNMTSAADQQQQQQQQQQCCTVILDSVACVSALAGGDTAQVHALLHSLAALQENLQVPCRLVLLASSDTPGTSLLLQSVASRCHVTADIHPVQGRTAALDGSMTVNTRRAPPHTRSNQQQHGPVGQSPMCSVGTNAGSSSSSSSSGVLRPGWLQPGCSSVWFFRCGDVGVKWLSEVHGKELLG